jgi:hypothetical protein
MVRSVGNTPPPEEPHHIGFDNNESVQIKSQHGAAPPRETQEAHAAETRNGAAHDVISALAGDPLSTGATGAISYGLKPGGAMRITSETVIPEGVKPGKIDQSKSKSPFRPHELLIAQKLAAEGYDVTKLPEGDGKPPRPADALISGNGVVNKKVEFKSMQPKPGQVSDSKTIRNQVSHSLDDGGQARDMILDGRGTGLTEKEARLGIDRIVPRGKLDSVRIMGDGFDLTAKFPQTNGKVS